MGVISLVPLHFLQNACFWVRIGGGGAGQGLYIVFTYFWFFTAAFTQIVQTYILEQPPYSIPYHAPILKKADSPVPHRLPFSQYFKTLTPGSQMGCTIQKRVWAYVDSKDPDQPAHPCSLIRVFTVHQQNHLTL